MTSQELRIGNWVLLDGNIAQINHAQQIELVNSLKGINLTQEWFDKFDFFSHSPWIYSIELNPKSALIFKGDNENYKCSLVVRNTIAGNQLYALTEIRFVHQLQNLCFAIMNKELVVHNT